jgi:hypothetical protein
MYTFMKVYFIFNFKVIHDLYSQCLTQILSKTTSFTDMEGVRTRISAT